MFDIIKNAAFFKFLIHVFFFFSFLFFFHKGFETVNPNIFDEKSDENSPFLPGVKVTLVGLKKIEYNGLIGEIQRRSTATTTEDKGLKKRNNYVL